MTAKVASKPRMSAPERRAAIVQAAIKLFAERGFRGTTTRELAAAVGVSEPVLYEHFRTKRDLYAAIIDESSKGGAEILSALVARASVAADDRSFFLGLAELVVRWYSEGSD